MEENERAIPPYLIKLTADERALLEASKWGRVDEVRALLEGGVSPNARYFVSFNERNEMLEATDGNGEEGKMTKWEKESERERESFKIEKGRRMRCFNGACVKKGVGSLFCESKWKEILMKLWKWKENSNQAILSLFYWFYFPVRKRFSKLRIATVNL